MKGKIRREKKARKERSSMPLYEKKESRKLKNGPQTGRDRQTDTTPFLLSFSATKFLGIYLK